MTKKMTDKQAAFVAEYAKDMNASQAALRAGYSQKRAGEIGYQLLQKTPIQNAIEQAQEARAKRCELKADDIIAELRKIAFAEPPNAKNLSLDGQAQSAGVDTEIFTNGEAVTLKVRHKQSDKLKALELLGKHTGMFKDDAQANDAELARLRAENMAYRAAEFQKILEEAREGWQNHAAFAAVDGVAVIKQKIAEYAENAERHGEV